MARYIIKMDMDPFINFAKTICLVNVSHKLFYSRISLSLVSVSQLHSGKHIVIKRYPSNKETAVFSLLSGGLIFIFKTFGCIFYSNWSCIQVGL